MAKARSIFQVIATSRASSRRTFVHPLRVLGRVIAANYAKEDREIV